MNRDRVPPGRQRRQRQPSDPVASARRASAEDREERFYERKRAQSARRRAQLERRAFDPAPPSDDDWTVGDDASDGLHRLSPPVTLDDALQTLVRRKGWAEPLRSSAVWSSWTDIVGAELADRCEPVRIANGVLTIRAATQPWATQLRYLVGPLRSKCAEVLGEAVVKDIAIVVGRLERASEQA